MLVAVVSLVLIAISLALAGHLMILVDRVDGEIAKFRRAVSLH